MKMFGRKLYDRNLPLSKLLKLVQVEAVVSCKRKNKLLEGGRKTPKYL